MSIACTKINPTVLLHAVKVASPLKAHFQFFNVTACIPPILLHDIERELETRLFYKNVMLST